MSEINTNKLDEKICKAFPLLYRDRHASMQSTCMCWGFPFSDKNIGWFNLIWELSSKLEPLIQKYIDENKPTKCANCGCERNLHEFVGCITGRNSERTGKCFNLHHLPYHFQWKWKPYSWPSKATNWKELWKIFKAKYIHFLVVERVKNWISRGINYMLDDIFHQRFGITNVKPCWCKQYLLDHPCASQVKEKFGGLRFYMNSGTEEMYDLIHEAEEKSYHICEVCGNAGELRNEYNWYSTLCETCAVDRNGKRIPTAKEVEQEMDKNDI